MAPPVRADPKLRSFLVQVPGLLPTDWHRKPDEKRFPLRLDAVTDGRTDGRTKCPHKLLFLRGKFAKNDKDLN